MGPSGSGKTTLLDVLAGRKTAGKTTGSILFAGAPPTVRFLRRYTGYVEQFGEQQLAFPFWHAIAATCPGFCTLLGPPVLAPGLHPASPMGMAVCTSPVAHQAAKPQAATSPAGHDAQHGLYGKTAQETLQRLSCSLACRDSVPFHISSLVKQSLPMVRGC